MADIPLVSPQLLTLRAADDPICRVAEIIAELAHPLPQPIIPELPEADGMPAVTHRIPLPSALMPGVRQGARDPGIRPARPPEVPLNIAGIPRSDPHPIGHPSRHRAGMRGDRGLGRD